MGCFSCFDSPADEQLNPKFGGAGGYGGTSSAAAAYGAGTGAGIGRHGDRGYPDLQQAPMAAPRVEKLSAAAEKARVKSNALTKEASVPKDANGNVISAQTFTFRELATATRNFRPECFLGEGGFGRVYKGRLESTGQVVAIKQLNRDGLQGNREFLVEVLMLSLLHHQNLVNLIGYCADGDQRLLVYEYMPFGSLEDHLHGTNAVLVGRIETVCIRPPSVSVLCVTSCVPVLISSCLSHACLSLVVSLLYASIFIILPCYTGRCSVNSITILLLKPILDPLVTQGAILCTPLLAIFILHFPHILPFVTVSYFCYSLFTF